MTNIEKAFDEFTKGMMSLGDLELLSQICPGKIFKVELGTARGIGSLILSSFGGYVITIDIYQKYNWRKIKDYLGDIACIDARMNNTIDEAKHFKDNSIDLLYIDADHHYEAVKNDYYTWFSKVKTNGFIVFHDVDKAHGGVLKFYYENLTKECMDEKIHELHFPLQYPTNIKVFIKI